MQKEKRKPVESLAQLRWKMAEKFAALEDGEISVSEAKAFTGIATVIVKSYQTQLVENQMMGVTKQIDFIDDESKKIEDKK